MEYRGAEEARKNTSACFKRVGTIEEAEEFIESWKRAYADIWRWFIRRGLDNGWRPRDKKFNIELLFLREDGNEMKDNHEDIKIPGHKDNDDNELPKVEHLDIKDPKEEHQV
ncbi:hypothetical protein PHISCL_05771 [Aspergillus sclerotialis]|uniref:Uncharacterized protein n=1 Tax=Aspergillus sclerotialis TaxID=2070753 RepID=A0A3A2ZFW2_9EURO|nr:hypothetical protein PHISCL_05771 [Aspergillus sclerotialis]